MADAFSAAELSQSTEIDNRCQLKQAKCIKRWVHLVVKSTQNKRCGGAIIFERLKLPQQIIYRRKENLSESPNHLKYRENILISRFYDHFSRNTVTSLC